MTDHEEAYVHLATCVGRLQDAWRTLQAIKADPSGQLVGPAFRFALVEYATIYKASHSPSGKKRWLEPTHVPPSFAELHQRIMDSRDQTHAHSDTTVLDAKLYFNEIQGKRYVSIVTNTTQGIEELPNLNQVIGLVEGTLDKLFEYRDVLEARLVP